MAKPIKEIPELSGENANKFAKKMLDIETEPLDKKIKYGYGNRVTLQDCWGKEVIWKEDVKSSLSNLKKRLKEEMFGNYADGYKQKIKFNKILDKLFSEEIGSGLLEGENGTTK